MSDWSGVMTCIVTNQTGGPITKATTFHSWNDGSQGPLAFSLDAGGSVSFDFKTGSGHDDYWSVSFTDAEGSVWSRDDKQCNVDESDWESGNPVQIDLGAPATGWSVVLPVSTGCPDNYYDQSTG
jgi:hypothetical protein